MANAMDRSAEVVTHMPSFGVENKRAGAVSLATGLSISTIDQHPISSANPCTSYLRGTLPSTPPRDHLVLGKTKEETKTERGEH